ncbi:hypothetical protein T11_14183 [Trichinella zimbabwensis]|uniref:Uncharacterized protein n=1 Tax=Trichinella zimbabwensis TaxID=268475 RepID=A0A0V1GKR1_9BILA|nr:hypothetical protein T11_14183 [Trichinella zimbabwensis]
MTCTVVLKLHLSRFVGRFFSSEIDLSHQLS